MARRTITASSLAQPHSFVHRSQGRSPRRMTMLGGAKGMMLLLGLMGTFTTSIFQSTHAWVATPCQKVRPFTRPDLSSSSPSSSPSRLGESAVSEKRRFVLFWLRPSSSPTWARSVGRPGLGMSSFPLVPDQDTSNHHGDDHQDQSVRHQNIHNNNNQDHLMWTPPPHWKFAGIRRSQPVSPLFQAAPSRSSSYRTSSSSAPPRSNYEGYNSAGTAGGGGGALMPDGGLSPCVIKVIGVGGGGCNAVDRMLDTAVGGVEFWALNTDAQALGRSKAKGAKVLNIGASVTRGLGAGGNPEIGRLAGEESRKEIAAVVAGTDLCFVTSGMGGGTGSGAAPVVAEVAKEEGCLTVGIVTKPFAFEGKRRMKQALGAIERLREHVDTVIVVSNDRLLEIIPDDTPIERAFAVADDILRQGVVGISDIIVKPGLINVDFADVRAIMAGAGTALMGIGIGSGKTAAEDAAAAAISSPLLDSTIENAKGVVFNISGGPNLSLNEVNQAAKLIYSTVEADANVIFGALVDETLEDNISITVLATGFTEKGLEDYLRATGSRDRETAGAAAASPTRTSSPTSVRNKSSAGPGRVNNNNAASTSPRRTPLRRVQEEAPAMPTPAASESPATSSSSGKDKDKIPDFLKNLKKKQR